MLYYYDLYVAKFDFSVSPKTSLIPSPQPPTKDRMGVCGLGMRLLLKHVGGGGGGGGAHSISVG